MGTGAPDDTAQASNYAQSQTASGMTAVGSEANVVKMGGDKDKGGGLSDKLKFWS